MNIRMLKFLTWTGLAYLLLGSQSFAQEQPPKAPLVSSYLGVAFAFTDRLRKPDTSVPLTIYVSCSDLGCDPYVKKLRELLGNSRVQVAEGETPDRDSGISIVFAENSRTMKPSMVFEDQAIQRDQYPGCGLVVGTKGYSIKQVGVYVQIPKTYEELYTCTLVQLTRGLGLGTRPYEWFIQELKDAKLGKEKFEILLKGFAAMIALHSLDELQPGFTKAEAEAELTKLDFEYLRATPYTPGATIFQQ